MSGTRGGDRKGYSHGQRVAGVTLLALLGVMGGCQWAGDVPGRRPTLDPVAAVCQEAKYSPQRSSGVPQSDAGRPSTDSPTANAASGIVSVRASAASTRESDANRTGDMIPTSLRASPDEPSTDEKAFARQEGVSFRPQDNPGISSSSPPRPGEEQPVKWQDERARDRTAEKDQPYRVDRTLPSPVAGVITPVLPTPEKVLPISLGGALALAGAENPDINIAEQAVRASLIAQFQARILLLPNVNVGANYDMHNGPLQPSFGAIRKVDRQAVLHGLGAYSVAAETIKIPGLLINTPLAAVIFEPLVARQVVANRRFTATATRNDILLDVATAYVTLLGAEGRLAVIRQSEDDFREVVRLTRSFAKTGQGREGDAHRAEADALALEYQEKRAQEEVAVASADLAQLLNLDPSTRLQTGDVPIQVVQFVDPKAPLPQLLEIAVRNRPEVLAAAANIRASQVRVRQEKSRPLLPQLIMGFSADDFGGGAVASTNGNVFNPHTGFVSGAPSPETGGQTVPKFGRITGRTDVDVLAVWTLQNMGFGNIAHVRQRRAELGQAEAEQMRVINEVSREVTEAYSRSAQFYRSIDIERRRIEEASNGFQRDLNRIRAGEGFPIEVLNQAKRLAAARQALLEAVIGFDRAQFQLFVALGRPPTLVVEDVPPAKH